MSGTVVNASEAPQTVSDASEASPTSGVVARIDNASEGKAEPMQSPCHEPTGERHASRSVMQLLVANHGRLHKAPSMRRRHAPNAAALPQSKPVHSAQGISFDSLPESEYQA